MQHRLMWFVITVVLTLGARPVAAQDASDEWHVAVSPYLMGAAMGGTTTVRGFEADIDVSASDIFSNLQFGAMGMLAARKGNWGVGGDAVWMALGTTAREVNIDFNQGAFAFYGLRRLGAAADLTFGLRVNTLQGALDFKQLGRTVEQNETWVDPVTGLLLRTPETHRVGLRLYTEIGGFGVGSNFSWQVFPVLVVRLTDTASIDVAYRWLDLDYSTGEGADGFAYDVLTQGPVVGCTFRF